MFLLSNPAAPWHTTGSTSCAMRQAAGKLLCQVVVLCLVSGGSCVFASPAAERELDPAQPIECPFRFDTDMPPGVFCVYAGRIATPEGRTCSEDTAVIWSSMSPRPVPSAAGRPITIGFVEEPEVILS